MTTPTEEPWLPGWVVALVTIVALTVVSVFAVVADNRAPTKPAFHCQTGTPDTWTSHDGDGNQTWNVRCP